MIVLVQRAAHLGMLQPREASKLRDAVTVPIFTEWRDLVFLKIDKRTPKKYTKSLRRTAKRYGGVPAVSRKRSCPEVRIRIPSHRRHCASSWIDIKGHDCWIGAGNVKERS